MKTKDNTSPAQEKTKMKTTIKKRDFYSPLACVHTAIASTYWVAWRMAYYHGASTELQRSFRRAMREAALTARRLATP